MVVIFCCNCKFFYFEFLFKKAPFLNIGYLLYQKKGTQLFYGLGKLWTFLKFIYCPELFSSVVADLRASLSTLLMPVGGTHQTLGGGVPRLCRCFSTLRTFCRVFICCATHSSNLATKSDPIRLRLRGTTAPFSSPSTYFHGYLVN